jgi:RimJ/RimL family protein N-acetyltransferase
MHLPDFSDFLGRSFKNVKTGEPFDLRSAANPPAPAQAAKDIAGICNEPLVYDFLFRSRLGGREYGEEMAEQFLSWAAEGWAKRTHYVFIVTSRADRVVAALDIKSNDLYGPEIGYWASSKHPGVTTPAVGLLCSIALEAGYKKLVGLTLPENERSAQVLRRNAFVDLGLVEERKKLYRKFEKTLKPPRAPTPA